MDNELIYKIAISLIPRIGYKNGKELISYLGGVEAIFKEPKSVLMKVPGIGEGLASEIKNQDVLKQAANEVEFITKYNIKTLFYLDEDYPKRLKQCSDSPIILFSKGNVDYDKSKVVSIIGTRNATQYGKDICDKLVKEISEKHPETIIVSGLAYGIDVQAHKSALAHGLDTVAVLGLGLNKIYPSVHTNIAREVSQHGALLTEFLSTSHNSRKNFLKRNRIVAGISDATIVVESASKGGSLVTANIANSYNRDVFAFPGKVVDKYSEGCNNLIKSNQAALIQSVEDLEYILGWESDTNKKKVVQKNLFLDLKDEDKVVIDALKKHSNVYLDTLSKTTKIKLSKLTPILLNLEFAGYVKSLPGKVFSLA